VFVRCASVTTIEIVPVEPHITMLRLSRPERLNAISFELVGDLYDALDEIGADPECRVIVLTGSGRGFCAGLDLKDWGEPPAPGAHRHMNATGDAQAFVSNVVAALRATPQVVVAAVNGPAFGGGMALACASDIRIAAQSARFCSASIRTGLSGCEMGMTYTLPRLIGNARAFDLILTGRDIDAAEAFELGIVSKVVADDELIDTALGYARRMAGYTAAGLRTTKHVLWQNIEAPDLDAALALEINAQMRLSHSPEVTAYMTAYRTATTGPTRSTPVD
jgi:enoyl-CoA hydratase